MLWLAEPIFFVIIAVNLVLVGPLAVYCMWKDWREQRDPDYKPDPDRIYIPR